MPLEPREEKRVAELEERLQALEERNQRLERLLRSGRAFTNNPLSLDTDLDDLGSVKTFLDFEEVPAPDAPAPEVGRLYAKSSDADARLYWLNESGQEQPFILWQATTEAVSIKRGLASATIANGTRVKAGTVTHNAGWTSTGIVLCTVQNANAFGAGERPVSVTAYTVGANSFNYIIDCHANVAAARLVSFGWYADGVI